MDLAVFHCLDTSKIRIGKQLRVGVAHFFVENKKYCNLRLLKKIKKLWKKYIQIEKYML